MASYLKRGMRGAFFVVLFTVLASFFGYLTRVLLARTLTPEEFGLFYAVFTLFMVITIFTDFGYTSAMVRFIPHYEAKANSKSVAKTMTLVFAVTLALSIIAAILVLAFKSVLATHYFKSASADMLLILFSSIIVLGGLQNIMQTTFQAYQRMFLYGLFYFSQKGLFYVLALAGFLLGITGVMLPAIAYGTSIVLVLVLFLWPFLRRLQLTQQVDKATWVEITSFALPSLLNAVAGMVIGYIDTLILTFMVPLAEVGIYNAVLPTALVLSYVGGAIFSVFFPLVAELWTKKKRALLRKGLSITYAYVLAIVLPFALAMIFFAEPLLRLLFGPAFVQGSMALRFLAIGVVFLSLAQVNFSFLNGMGRPGLITRVTVAAAILNAVGNILLIPRWGMSGAAFMTLLSYALMFIWSWVLLYRRLPFTPQRLWRVFFSSAAFIIFLYALKSVVHSTWLLVLSLAAAFLLYGLLVLLFGIVRWGELRL